MTFFTLAVSATVHCGFFFVLDEIPWSVSSWALSSLGPDIVQGLITKWSVSKPLWLSLCAPLCMGTWWVSLHTQTTQQLSLRWMVVYDGCWWGGVPSPYCRSCGREERLHSVYIIKARRAHTHTEAFRFRVRLSLALFSVSVTLSNIHTDTLAYTSFTCCCSH